MVNHNLRYIFKNLKETTNQVELLFIIIYFIIGFLFGYFIMFRINVNVYIWLGIFVGFCYFSAKLCDFITVKINERIVKNKKLV